MGYNMALVTCINDEYLLGKNLEGETHSTVVNAMATFDCTD
jgi:hypothetical protein